MIPGAQSRALRGGLWIGLATLLLVALWLQLRTPFLHSNAVEEKLYALQAAENFERRGLGATFGLANYSTREQARPFVYTHLVDFPAYVIYALQRVGAGHSGVKLFFVCVNALGLALFWPLFRNFASPLLATAFVTVLATSPSLFPLHDHLHWPLTPLATGIAVLLALRQLKAPSTAVLWLAAGNVAFAATFSWFAAFNITAFCALLAMMNRGRCGTLALAAAAGGSLFLCVAAKLWWNSLYLGYPTAFWDFWVTMTNRIVGVPGYQEMQAQFNEKGIVLWGSLARSEPFLFGYYAELGIQILRTLGLGAVAALFAILLQPSRAMEIGRRRYPQLSVLLALTLALLGWAVFFPSHSAGYVNPLFQSWGRLVGFVILAFLLREGLLAAAPQTQPAGPASTARKLSAAVLAVLIPAYVCVSLVHNAWTARDFASISAAPYAGPPHNVLRHIAGRVAFTNLSVIHLGYFAKDALLAGRCTPDAALRRSVEYCYNIFESLSDADVRARLSAPEVFVFAPIQLSGNAPWTSPAELRQFQAILDKAFAKIGVYRDAQLPANWDVYDLRIPRGAR